MPITLDNIPIFDLDAFITAHGGPPMPLPDGRQVLCDGSEYRIDKDDDYPTRGDWPQRRHPSAPFQPAINTDRGFAFDRNARLWRRVLNRRCEELANRGPGAIDAASLAAVVPAEQLTDSAGQPWGPAGLHALFEHRFAWSDREVATLQPESRADQKQSARAAARVKERAARQAEPATA